MQGLSFSWKGAGLNNESRNRMSTVAKELAAFTTEDSIIGCRSALCKKISPSFTTSEDLLSGNALLYFMIYNHNCEILIGNTDTEIFVN
jgi:hypothetical protein